ncbi:MAG: hypothetical protein COC06_08150 [Bacteroidales bacterium]|nr:MAG: hypothetical protein COC06_08150 [Bacteroidales bacterium]
MMKKSILILLFVSVFIGIAYPQTRTVTLKPGVKIRKLSTAVSKVIKEINYRTTAQILSKSTSGYYKVKCKGVVGYVHEMYLTGLESGFVSESKKEYQAVKTLKIKSGAKIRKSSTAVSKVVKEINYRTVAQILSKSTSGYYKVKCKGVVGYVHEMYLTGLKTTKELEDEKRREKDTKVLALYSEARSFEKMGEFGKALECIDKAIVLKSDIFKIYIMAARMHRHFEKYNKAIADYSKMIEIAPNNHNYYRGRGYMYKKLGKRKDAGKDFMIAIEKTGSFNAKAWIKCFAGDITGALHDVNIALDRTRSAIVLDTRATAYGLNNNFKEALDDFDEALMLEPYAMFIYKRGLIKKAMSNTIEAEQDFAKAKKIDPTESYLYDDPLIDYFTENTNNFSNQLPPILVISDISFSKSILGAEEMAQLKLTIKNVGPGVAQNVSVNLSGYLSGLSFPAKTVLPSIAANGGLESISIDIRGGINLPTSEAVLKIEVVESNFKVRIQGKQLKFPTKEFRKPELILAKYAVIENQSASPNNQIDINEMVDLKFAIQNVGQGNAENVKVKIENNQKGVMFLGLGNENKLIGQAHPGFTEIQSGKFKTVIYRYFINSEFTDDQLEFSISTNERVGKYGFHENKTFPVNKQLEESGHIRTIAQTADSEIKGKFIIEDIPDFVVDVDVNIPVTTNRKPYTYALVIGNEDYSTKQQTLEKEADVPYALNDARVFSNYLNQTFGVPKENINLLTNATGNQILQAIDKLSKLTKHSAGKAEIIFYYAGHGLPDQQTRDPYLIPVDVSGANIKYGIKLNNVYQKLTKHPSKRVLVFLDACFSGGARNTPLIASRGINVTPKKEYLKGNILVFASSSGNQVSSAWKEKQHGLFTYFLLKKIKDTKGDLSLKDLSNYLQQKVPLKAITINKPEQVPTVNSSLEIKDVWHTWKLNE